MHAALIGGRQLFAREDSVEETWRIVRPDPTTRKPGSAVTPLAAAMAARGPLSLRTAEPEGCYGGSARM